MTVRELREKLFQIEDQESQVYISIEDIYDLDNVPESEASLLIMRDTKSPIQHIPMAKW